MMVRTLRFVVVVGAVVLLNACSSPGGRTPSQGPVIDGQAVADRLNVRYANNASDCNGLPANLCSGVTIRVLDPFDRNLQPLDPTPTQIARNGVSFTYLREDQGIRIFYQGAWAGYVVDLQPKPGFTPLTTRCHFPVNAVTNTRPDSCGRSLSDQTPTLKSRPCVEQGITTPQAWGQYFHNLQSQNFSCSFDASTEGFLTGLQARQYLLPSDSDFGRINEMVIAVWNKDDVGKLPVEAMFYAPLENIPFAWVQTHQCRIYHATGQRIPLLRIHSDPADGKVFTFDPADQIDFDNATPACSYTPKTGAKP